LRAIEQAKGELLEALPPSGTGILNADDPIVRAWPGGTVARTASYGFAEDADVRAEEVESAGFAGMRFVLRAAGERHPVTIPTLGRLRSTTVSRRQPSGSRPASTSTRSSKVSRRLVGSASRQVVRRAG
jgi:UDP-N-acetylmuramyl pentapeptide synthase